MHTVEILEQGIDALKLLGYRIREECVGGSGGGSCVLRGQKWFFLDPTLDIPDQLDLVCEALRYDPASPNLVLSDQLRCLVDVRKSA